MLIDDKNVYSDSQSITATADSTNKVCAMAQMGRLDVGDAFITVKVTEAFNNLTSLQVDLQQSDTESGSYTSVQTMTLALASLTKGAFFGFRDLPRNLTKKWTKLVYTVTGSAPSTGKIFAALTREEGRPYSAGLYINKGSVIG